MRKPSIISVLLSLYSSIPVLITGLTMDGRNGFSAAYSLFLFFIQFGLILILFCIKSRSRVVGFSILIFFWIAATGTASGFLLDRAYYSMFLFYYPGPLLALSYSLIFRFFRRQVFDQLIRGLNFIIILLASYSLMLLFMRIYFLFSSHQIAEPWKLVSGFYEAANYIPAVLFLMNLKSSASKKLIFFKGRLFFRNEDITASFNEPQIQMLTAAVEQGRNIRCRDYFRSTGADLKGMNCDDVAACKASLCPGYAAVYRYVTDLGKKLENYGIGMIIPPENKRNVVEEGWGLILYPDVAVEHRRTKSVFRDITEGSFSALLSEKAVLNTVKPRKKPGPVWFILSVIIAVSGSLLFAFETPVNSRMKFIILFCMVLSILVLPLFIRKRKIIFRTQIISAVFLFFLAYSLNRHDEIFALFSGIRNFVICTIIFLLGVPAVEFRSGRLINRDRTSGIIYWLIWFFMVILSISRDMPLSAGFQATDRFIPDILAVMADRILLIIFFVLSVIFFTLPGKLLEQRNGSVLFMGRPLLAGLSETNMEILKMLLTKDDETLYCSEILEHLEPETAEGCSLGCKASSCAHYQKIYKRIQTIRKFLETSGIGTIKSPERKAFSNLEGWHLALYEDVMIRK